MQLNLFRAMGLESALAGSAAKMMILTFEAWIGVVKLMMLSAGMSDSWT